MRGRALLGVGLLAALSLAGAWRAPRCTVPPRVPAGQAEPWMADSLPGIGPARRDQAARAIRAGDFAALPPAARAPAAEAFLPPGPE
jgi:hypothetical protein